MSIKLSHCEPEFKSERVNPTTPGWYKVLGYDSFAYVNEDGERFYISDGRLEVLQTTGALWEPMRGRLEIVVEQ